MIALGLLLGPRILPDPASRAAPTRYFDLVSTEPGLARGHLEISRDGTLIVYVAGQPARLFARSFGEPAAREIPGTTGAAYPCLSPDGTRVGFVQGGQLKTLPLAGGTATIVASVDQAFGLFWGDDGFLYFSNLVEGYPALARVDARGGGIETLVPLVDEAGRRQIAYFPRRVSGRTELVFTRLRGDNSDQFAAGNAVVYDPRHATTRELGVKGHLWAVLASGHLAVQTSPSELSIVPLDLDTLEVKGETRVIRDVFHPGALSLVTFSMSDTGTLIYEPFVERRDRLAWIDSAGAESPLEIDLGAITGPTFAPDGNRLAILTHRGSLGLREEELTVLDLERGVAQPIWTGRSFPTFAWAPDGRTIFWTPLSNEPARILRIASDGSTPPEEIRSTGSLWTMVQSVTPALPARGG